MPHTPGPWSVNAKIFTDGDYHVCSMADGERTLPLRDEREANARLIAAAPDLLDLMRELRDVLDISDPYRPELAKRVDAVIAKATEERIKDET